MAARKTNWTENVFELCQQFSDKIKNEYDFSLSSRVSKANGSIDKENFQRLLLDFYTKHSQSLKSVHRYTADNELDSHKRGACLFYAIMDVALYDENPYLLNETIAIIVAYNHVHESMLLSLDISGISENLLRYIRIPAFHRENHAAFQCLYEEGRGYFECLTHALHLECKMRDSSSIPNFSMLSMILFHYELNELLWLQVLTGRNVRPR